MHLSDAGELALKLLGEAEVRYQLNPLVYFKFDRAKRRLGSYRPAEMCITLSAPITRLNGLCIIDETLRHEIAHALAHQHDGYLGHRKKWKKWAIKCGAEPRTRCSSQNVITPKAPYIYICPVCDFKTERYRRPAATQGRAGCPNCSSSTFFQPLKFICNN